MGAGGSRPLPQWGSGVLPRENLGNFICQTVHFGEICVIIGPQNGSILFCWILTLRRFWVNFLTRQQYNVGTGTSRELHWRNRKGTYAKLAFIITKSVFKLLVLWQNIGGEITYLVPPNKLLGGHVSPVPPVSAPMVSMTHNCNLLLQVGLCKVQRCQYCFYSGFLVFFASQRQQVTMHHAKFGGNRTMHISLKWQSLMFSLCLFLCSGLVQQHRASVFVGRFRWGLQQF